MKILAIFLTLTILSLSIPSNISAKSKYTIKQRFGLGLTSGQTEVIENFPYSQIGAGWYLDWAYQDGFRPDIQYAALVGAGSTFNAPPTPTSPRCNQIRNHVNTYPNKYINGMFWIIGNELGWDDTRTPDQYAEEFIKWRSCIKSINQTFKVTSGAIIQPRMQLPGDHINVICVNPSDPKSGMSYFKKYIEKIRSLDPNSLPEAITNHGYTPCNAQNVFTTSNWGNLDLFKESIRLQRQAMKEVGLENLDLVIKEFGPLDARFTGNLSQYMSDTINFMALEKDTQIGNPQDEYRLVQKWSWFPLNGDVSGNQWRHLELVDPATKTLTTLGNTYKLLLSDLSSQQPAILIG